MDGIFAFIPRDGFVHRLNPVTKLVAAFLCCIAAAICMNHVAVLALTIVLLLLSATFGGFGRSMKLVLGLGSLACIVLVLQVLCVQSGDIYFAYGPLKITSDGVWGGILVVLKVVCMVLPLTMVFMTTRITDITDALVVRCHLPYKYAFTITTAIRFIPTFAEEMQGIMEAQRARGVALDTKNPVKKLTLMVPLCVPLLVGSVRKTDSIAISARLRGFGLRTRTSGYRDYPFGGNDVAAFIITIVACALTVAANVL